MKKIFAVVALSALVATMAYAGSAPKTGINGSMHDINAVAGYADDELQRTCVFCHTPHNAQTTALAPLWNHAPSGQTLAAYTWASPANASIAFAADPLIGPSRLCQACHDGVTAVDSHGTGGLASHAAGGNTPMSSSYTDALSATNKRYIDDLSVTHPIGFQYADAELRGINEIVPQTTGFITAPTTELLAATFNTQSRGALATGSKKISDTLYGGFMTCASCHDVHNSVNASPDAGHTYNYFLYAKQEGSAICLSCHVK